MTPKNRVQDDDERFRKLKPLEQIHELEDLLEALDDEIDKVTDFLMWIKPAEAAA